MYLRMHVEIVPCSRFLATAETATFPTQIGLVIYTKVQGLKGTLGDDLTWETALGASVRLWRWRFYAPLFFWRVLS